MKQLAIGFIIAGLGLSACASRHLQCRIVRDGTQDRTKWHHGIKNCQAGAEVMADENDPDLTFEYKGPAKEVHQFKKWFVLKYGAPVIVIPKDTKPEPEKSTAIVFVR